MEAEYQMLQDEREARLKEKQANNIIFNQAINQGKVEKKPAPENEATGGLTAEQLQEAEMLIDPEGA
jgi:hypothetical protein